MPAAPSHVLPWPVAEAIARRIARSQSHTIAVFSERSTRRMLRVAPEAAPPGRPLGVVAAGTRAETVVSIEDALEPSGIARARLLERAASATYQVILCEPEEAGHGIGRDMFQNIDPGFTRLRCDEVPDGLGGTRMRREIEAPALWMVASAASWRFEPGAEDVRAGLRQRLPRMRVEQMLLSVRRVMLRWRMGFEVFALAGEELARREDRSGLERVRAELRLQADAPRAVTDALHRLAMGLAPVPTVSAAATAS